MSLAVIGKETVEITERGWYATAAGVRVAIGDGVARAVTGTRLFRPTDFDRLPPIAPAGRAPLFEVTGETTAEAARRLVQSEQVSHVAALNFASAKNPGGGFLGGARAQEEDLARCSALYACQVGQRDYYAANRATASMLYTDHLIYSPDVPFFRDETLALLAEPFVVSLLTSPAPNAGEARARGEEAGIGGTLERRASHVLRVAAHYEHRTLVLGAWGCGVFRNDPAIVADVFARLLARSSFARVVFAVYDRTKSQATRRAFEERFAKSDSAASDQNGDTPLDS